MIPHRSILAPLVRMPPVLCVKTRLLPVRRYMVIHQDVNLTEMVNWLLAQEIIAEV